MDGNSGFDVVNSIDHIYDESLRSEQRCVDLNLMNSLIESLITDLATTPSNTLSNNCITIDPTSTLDLLVELI